MPASKTANNSASAIVQFAGLPFGYTSVTEEMAVQEAPPVREGPEGTRSGRQGSVSMLTSSMSGGLVSAWHKPLNWTQANNVYVYSEGAYTHTGGIYKPYLLQLQASITSGEDISGKVAANQRMTGINSTIGATVPRFYCAGGTKFWTETSTSDHSLLNATAPSDAGGTLIAFTCLREGIFNSVREIIAGVRHQDTVGGGNTSHPIAYHTTNPAGGPPTWNDGIEPGGAWTDGYFGTLWGFELLEREGVGFNFYYYSANVASGSGTNTATLGYTAITATRTTAPTALTDTTSAATLVLPDGGWVIGKDPTNEHNVYLSVPEKADAVGVTIPRKLVKLAFTNNTAGTVLTATLTTPWTSLATVVAGCFYLGQVALAGDESSNASQIGTRVVLSDGAGGVTDLGLPKANGTKPWGVRSMTSQGRYLICHMVYVDGTDAGIMYYVDKTWHLSVPLFSKRATNSGTPIAWGQGDQISTNLRRIYDFVPNTTNTDVYRTFVPADLGADPLLVNTTEKKHYGDLYLQTAETNRGGPEEANKSLVQREMLSRSVSTVAQATFGTVTIVSGIAGSAGSFSTGSNVFDVPYEIKNIAAGVSFETMADRITLSDGATTEGNSVAWTPNAVPYVDTYDVSWPQLRQWTFVLAWDTVVARQKNWANLVALMKAALNRTSSGKPTGRTLFGNVDTIASLESYRVALAPARISEPLDVLADPAKPPILVLRESPGAGS